MLPPLVQARPVTVEFRTSGPRLFRAKKGTLMPRVLIILNPSAGHSKPEAVREELDTVLQSHPDWTADIRVTEGPDHARRWAGMAQKEGFDRIVVAGGDGTIAEAATGLVVERSSLPLGIVPTGTANVIGEVLHLPTTAAEALAVALQGEPQQFDVGYLPELDRHFLVGLGIGLPAKAVENADRKAKDRFGFAAYVFAFVEGLVEGRSAVIDLEIDGEPIVAAGQSGIVANMGKLELLGRTVGGSISPHDRSLDLFVIDHTDPRTVLEGIAQLFGAKGKGDAPGFSHWRGSSIKINANPVLSVQVDGEWIGRTPVEIALAANSVHLVPGPDYAPNGEPLAEEPATGAS
jgi:diacylglycerol kinase family enzyme